MSFLALLLFFIVNIIRPQDWFGPLLGLPLMSVLFFVMLFSVLVSQQRHDFNFRHVCLTFVAGYLGTVFFSSLINDTLPYAFDVTLKVAKVAFFLLVPVMIVFSAKRAERSLMFLFCLILLVGLEIISVAWGGEGLAGQMRLQGSYYRKEIRIPWVGIWDGPNVVAVLLLVGSSISLVSLFNARDALKKLFFAGSFLTLLLAIYYTGSRGAILTIPVIVSCYFVLIKKVKWLIFFGLVALIFGCYFYKPQRDLSSKESSAHERMLLWEKGLIDLRYKGPFFGIGYGKFIENPYKLIAHSNYVQTFSELGLVGFFFFVGTFYVVMKRMFLISRLADLYGEDVARVAQAILLALTAIAVSTLFVVMNYEIMYFLLGMGLACERIADRAAPTGFAFSRSDLGGILAVMTLLLSFYYVLSVHRVV